MVGLTAEAQRVGSTLTQSETLVTGAARTLRHKRLLVPVLSDLRHVHPSSVYFIRSVSFHLERGEGGRERSVRKKRGWQKNTYFSSLQLLNTIHASATLFQRIVHCRPLSLVLFRSPATMCALPGPPSTLEATLSVFDSISKKYLPS